MNHLHLLKKGVICDIKCIIILIQIYASFKRLRPNCYDLKEDILYHECFKNEKNNQSLSRMIESHYTIKRNFIKKFNKSDVMLEYGLLAELNNIIINYKDKNVLDHCSTNSRLTKILCSDPDIELLYYIRHDRYNDLKSLLRKGKFDPFPIYLSNKRNFNGTTVGIIKRSCAEKICLIKSALRKMTDISDILTIINNNVKVLIINLLYTNK
jgi:hypothetical protein